MAVGSFFNARTTTAMSSTTNAYNHSRITKDYGGTTFQEPFNEALTQPNSNLNRNSRSNFVSVDRLNSHLGENVFYSNNQNIAGT